MDRRQKYDRAVKIEAVKLVTQRGTSVAEAARNLGSHENLLSRWKHQYLEDAPDAFPGTGDLKPPG